MTRMKIMIAAMALGLAACGSSAPTSVPDPSNSSRDIAGEESIALGAPAEAKDADRVIDIDALDALRFDPSTIEVSKGETILFRVVNTGSALHDFTLGDKATQDEHEAAMQAGTEPGIGHDGEDGMNAVEVPAGETVELAWTFQETGTTLYGCHLPGHYAGGMVGTITVS